MGLVHDGASIVIGGGSSLLKYVGLVSGIYGVLDEGVDNVNYLLVGIGGGFYLCGEVLSRTSDIILSDGTKKDIRYSISELEEKIEDNLFEKGDSEE